MYTELSWGYQNILSLTKLLLCLFLMSFALSTFAINPNSAKYAAIVIDYKTGKVLFSRNAHAIRYPASLTKIMTLYMVFDALDKGHLKLNQRLKVSKFAANQSPSRLNLYPGSTITVKNAILSLVTKSANDAACVLAESVAGSEADFARAMTAKAKQLGMRNTIFYNASGLPNTKQITTAADMARLSLAMLRDFPKYYHYFSTRQFKYKNNVYNNHNKLLKSYEGMDGIKTGYIHASGYNLAASAKRNGRRVVAVVMGGATSQDRNDHVANLLDSAFAEIVD